MKLPQFNGWALLGVALMFASSVFEAGDHREYKFGCILLALCAFGAWFYTGRRV